MSNFYLDIIKDRLYCDEANGLLRRSAQSVIYTILDALVRMLAPILAFTSEEIWDLMPHHSGTELDSVLYNPMPESNERYAFSRKQVEMWEDILKLRTDVYKALELARIDKIIGKSLEAEVTLYLDNTAFAAFDKIADKDFRTLFIVSDINIVKSGGDAVSGQNAYKGTEFPGVTVVVNASSKPKCIRCWKHDKDIGKNEKHPELCPRCLDVVLKIER